MQYPLQETSISCTIYHMLCTSGNTSAKGPLAVLIEYFPVSDLKM